MALPATRAFAVSQHVLAPTLSRRPATASSWANDPDADGGDGPAGNNRRS
jgi:hypothetical protein